MVCRDYLWFVSLPLFDIIKLISRQLSGYRKVMTLSDIDHGFWDTHGENGWQVVGG